MAASEPTLWMMMSAFCLLTCAVGEDTAQNVPSRWWVLVVVSRQRRQLTGVGQRTAGTSWRGDNNQRTSAQDITHKERRHGAGDGGHEAAIQVLAVGQLLGEESGHWDDVVAEQGAGLGEGEMAQWG